jgi:hypothetical protein
VNELTIKKYDGEIFTSKDTVRVIGRPRPLLQEHINLELPAGHTVAELIDMACGQRKSHMPVNYMAYVDGAPIPYAMQDRVRLKPGHTLTFEPRLSGEAGRSIALIAVAVVALVLTIALPFVGVPLLAAQLISLGVVVGGSLAVNALFPIAPPKTPLSQLPTNQESVYSISGARNSAAPFDPVPSVLGRVRVYPRYAALPFTSFSGEDQYLRMLFVIGYGPLDLSDFKIGETDIDDFEDVDIEIFEGYASDDEPTLYTRAAFEEALSVDLSDHDGTWFTRTTESDVTEIGGDISAPQGWFKVNTENKVLGMNFKVRVEYRAVGAGSWTTIIDKDESGFKKKHPYRFGFSTNVTRGPAYEVRVRSTSANPDEDNFQVTNTLAWITLRAFRPGDPIRFNKPLSVIALKIKASGQLNSIIDTFNLIASSRVNSFNGTSWDTSNPNTWDESSNPADLIRHVLQGPAIYQAVPDDQLDLDTIEGFWQYCEDEGWEYNREHSFSGSVIELLQTIASAGRGRIVRTDGKWGVIWDEADVPVAQHFSHRNSWGFEEFRPYMNPPHAYRCPFVNEQKGWAADERIVYADDFDEDNAELFESIEFPGVTDPDKVWRLARFQMAQTLLRPSTYTLTTNWQALSCTVGSRVYVNHDVAEWGIAAGRVVDVTGDVLLLDEEVQLELGFNYLIRFRQSDGTSVIRQVTVPQVGATKRLILTASASPDPEVGDLVMFGNDVGGPAVLLRVRDIEWLPDLNARLTLVDDAPGIADADTGDIPEYDSQVTTPTNVFLRQPYNLSVISQTYLLGGVPKIRAMISWGALAVNVTAFDVEMRNDGLDVPIWEKLITVGPDVLSTEADDLDDGVYSFRVRSVFGGNLGWSAWTELLGVTLLSTITVPPDVTNFRITNLGDMALLSWDAVDAPDISYYVIRQSSATVGVTWGTSAILFDKVLGLSVPVPPLTGTYLIKAVNYSGLESVNPTLILSNAVNLRDLNVVLSLDPASESPPWPGTIINMVVDGNELVLDGNDGSLIDRSSGTAIGNMTDFGGLAAAFDGDTDQIATVIASLGGTVRGNVGKTFDTPTAISKAITYAGSNSGYTTGANYLLRLFGKQGAAPVSTLDGTLLGSVTGADFNGANPQTITSSDTDTEWDHVWVTVSDDVSGTGTQRLAELELYAAGDAVGYYAPGFIADLGAVYTSRISASLNAYGDNVANVMSSWLTLSSVSELSGAQDSEWAIRIEERHTSDDPEGTSIDLSGGTNIGDLTGGGGLAAAFNGNTNQAIAASASNSGTANRYIGKTLATAAPITRAMVYGGNDTGFIQTLNSNVTIALYGKTGSAPSSSTNGTLLGQVSFVDTANESAGREIVSTDIDTVWDHVWVRIVNDDAATNNIVCAELQLFEATGWTDWAELSITDITARAFDFRAYVYSFNPDVDVHIVSAILSIDMPDRIEGIGDFVVSNTGTPHVSFSVPFNFLETVLVTAIQGASTGDYADVTNRDEEGFDIMVFDSADVRVTRTVDILAVGYGKEVA